MQSRLFGLPLALAIVVGCAVAAVSGLLIEEIFYRPLRRLGAPEHRARHLWQRIEGA